MKKHVGLWIDSRKAIVVMVSDEGEVVKEITSDTVKRFQISAREAQEHDWQNATHPNHYYDAVIAMLEDSDTIQIFGPDETKGELEKRIESKESGDRIVRVEPAEKMTERQITAKVRQYLRLRKAQSARQTDNNDSSNGL